jgi:hypothetical protein
VTYKQLDSNFSTPELSARLHPAAVCAARVRAHIQHTQYEYPNSASLTNRLSNDNLFIFISIAPLYRHYNRSLFTLQEVSFDTVLGLFWHYIRSLLTLSSQWANSIGPRVCRLYPHDILPCLVDSLGAKGKAWSRSIV